MDGGSGQGASEAGQAGKVRWGGQAVYRRLEWRVGRFLGGQAIGGNAGNGGDGSELAG